LPPQCAIDGREQARTVVAIDGLLGVVRVRFRLRAQADDRKGWFGCVVALRVAQDDGRTAAGRCLGDARIAYVITCLYQ
jgi:2-polyprenyl-6-methoxyphenol hydroxylase-like FAD-dependent oxidoreductase